MGFEFHWCAYWITSKRVFDTCRIWLFDRGYRLAATTVLPIDKDTLIYGSGTSENTLHGYSNVQRSTADGGKTVMMSNPLVNKAMEDAAKYLNIKPHRVTDNLITIHSPIGNWQPIHESISDSIKLDVEVHEARDNNYYVSNGSN